MAFPHPGAARESDVHGKRREQLRAIQWRVLVGGLLLVLGMMAVPRGTQAEWYVAGYGGISTAGSLSSITMPLLGQRLAEQQFPQVNDPLDSGGRGTLFQDFKASDISLKSSAIFGGKVGYFFAEEGFSWLGIELEAFRTSPTIKAQTLSTIQNISYQPNTPAPAVQCPPPPQPQVPNCPAFVLNRSSLSIQESTLNVITVAFNVIARYPGTMFQPYVGVGGGAFNFSASGGSIQGNQWYPGLNLMAGAKLLVTEEFGVFVEGKYNLANVSNFDQTFGLSATYSIFHFVAGLAYHF
jgi:hypothetical protein